MRSGLAEMLKHGLIHDINYWNHFKDLSALTLNDLDELIHESIVIKRISLIEILMKRMSAKL